MLPTTFLKLVFASILSVASAQSDEDTPELPPGDLVNGVTSAVGQAIIDIIAGNAVGQNDTLGPVPGPDQAETDPCYVWYDIADQLYDLMSNDDGTCNDFARAAIRMVFHDSGTWASSLAAEGMDYGGSDGSLFLFAEYQRPENDGLEDAVNQIGELAASNGVGVADMFIFAGATGVVTCPLGPRMRTWLGRIDATQPSPMNLLPSAFDNGTFLINLFQDKRISPHDLTALVGAHSTSKQFTTNLTQLGFSQDSTPGTWDVDFYNETQFAPLPGVFQFPSDLSLLQTDETRVEWLLFVGNQEHWNEDFAAAFLRLTLAGVNNINDGLFECTDALPANVGPDEIEAEILDTDKRDVRDTDRRSKRSGEKFRPARNRRWGRK